MKKLISAAAIVAGTAIAGIGTFSLIKSSKSNKCACNFCECDCDEDDTPEKE